MQDLIWNVDIVTKKHIKTTCFVGSRKKTTALTVGESGKRMDLDHLPLFLQGLVMKIEALIDSRFPQRSKILPVKIRNRRQNSVLSWNIFPSELIELKDFYQTLEDLITTQIKNVKGEIIQSTLARGEITDTGVQEFKIISGKTWDIYLYDPEIFIYLRLLHESRLTQDQDGWISIDIDLVNESAWFCD
ncbi:MAG: hypothetical protein JSV04_14815 [Candidatus Heimdallarchaeota archaeon]|nr:MAG: hypothetical protein JSV04_14815 [Candidatus Heimdallarchaeota archaeon]